MFIKGAIFGLKEKNFDVIKMQVTRIKNDLTYLLLLNRDSRINVLKTNSDYLL
jgi:hypothetical protein